jgi:hypothetical protein
MEMLILNQATLFEGLPILPVQGGDPRRISQSMYSLSAHSSNEDAPGSTAPHNPRFQEIYADQLRRSRGYSNPIARPGDPGRPPPPEGVMGSPPLGSVGLESRSASLPPGQMAGIGAGEHYRPSRPLSMRLQSTSISPMQSPEMRGEEQGNPLADNTLSADKDDGGNDGAGGSANAFALYRAYEANRGPSPAPPPIRPVAMPPGAGFSASPSTLAADPGSPSQHRKNRSTSLSSSRGHGGRESAS